MLNFLATFEDFGGRNLGLGFFGFCLKVLMSMTIETWVLRWNRVVGNCLTTGGRRISREKPELLSLEFFWRSLVREGKRWKWERRWSFWPFVGSQPVHFACCHVSNLGPIAVRPSRQPRVPRTCTLPEIVSDPLTCAFDPAFERC